jgi:ribonuclease HI
MLKFKPVIIKRKKPPPPAPRTLSQREQRYFDHPDYKPVPGMLNVYTDGSTVGNGRLDATGGYGVFFANPSIPYISQTIEKGKVTNNIAELKAMIEALKVLRTRKETEIVIYYDSKYAEGAITGRNRAHKNVDLVSEGKSLLLELRATRDIEFKHVYSHTNRDDLHSIGNNIVDDLAKRNPLT